MRGQAYPAINDSDFALLPFPLPPLAEQRRIVAKVDELMALCDRLEAQQADAEAVHATLVKTLLDTLTQSQDADDFVANWHRLSQHFPTIFTTEASVDALKQTVLRMAMSGRLANLHPEQWEAVLVGQMLTKINYGTAKKCEHCPEKTAVYRIPNIKDGRLDKTDLKHADFDDKEWRSLELHPGDVLVIRSNGSPDLVGRPALVSQDDVDALYAGYLIRLRLDQKRVLPDFFVRFLISPDVRTMIESLARSTSGVNNINSEHIKSLELRLPPLAEQHRIVAKVDELLALCDTLKAQINESRKVQRLLAVALIDQTLAA
jgi:type I restriction enzyme S subunit